MENIRIWRIFKTYLSSKLVTPHSQIRGEIVTLLVKILKLYQLVEEAASKSSLSFLSADQSPSLSSSLRSRSRGHWMPVSTWKKEARSQIPDKKHRNPGYYFAKGLGKRNTLDRRLLRRELRRSYLVQFKMWRSSWVCSIINLSRRLLQSIVLDQEFEPKLVLDI